MENSRSLQVGSNKLLPHPRRVTPLDNVSPLTIITVFYATPSMPHDWFLIVVKHAKLLRTKLHAGAKSIPNTPLILQEIK